ncbi:MAG: transketolase [Treponema sp.]|nr:transketolase [Treponema sp.]
MINCDEIKSLQNKAQEIRRLIVKTAYESQRLTHPGPALSIADICTALYYKFMNVDPQNPAWENRDRMVLSKGHACLVLYAILADKGFFPHEHLKTLRHPGSILQGHPVLGKTPGVDMTTGSLGNGLGAGLGMAYYLKHTGKPCSVYVILGDGEMNEGTVWEAVTQAPVLGVNNLIAIVDMNGFQSGGTTQEICPMNNMRQRWEPFGWKTLEVNGHDMAAVVSALDAAANYRGGPVCIVADTVKGKGVSFMEHNNDYHQKLMTKELYDTAMTELGGR